MLQAIIEQCKEQKQAIESTRFVLIQENQYQHSDFLVVGWILSELAQERSVTLITFRQNYAHFLSLSKKLGKSIESYIKKNQLTYIECFQSSFCSELPLTETTPQTYASPPSMVKRIYSQRLVNEQNLFKKGDTLVIDSISFIDENIELCYWLYEQAMLHSNKLILGGCLDESPLARIFEIQAPVVVKLNSDVGGYGKFTIKSQKCQSSILWKNVNCKLQFSKHISI